MTRSNVSVRGPFKARTSSIRHSGSAAFLAAALLASAIACAPRAAAAWHEASTEHFVLYADEKPGRLERRARRLERLHDAFVRLFDIPDARPSPSNRLTVFVLPDTQQVNQYFDNPMRAVNGFFVGAAGRSAAFVAGGRLGGDDATRAERVLAHEYAHFLMWRKQAAVLPPWLSEGHAQFAGSVAYDRDDVLWFGAPDERLLERIATGARAPLAQVLTARSVDEIPAAQLAGFYGTSFALYHFLHFQADGEQQIDRYLRALAGGASLADAATSAFGDGDALAQALAEYLRRDLPLQRVPDHWHSAGSVDLRKLPRAEAQTMAWRMWLMRGVTTEKAASLIPGLNNVVDRHGDSDAAVATLAGLYYAARNDALAAATAQRVLARSPRHLEANLVKMMALHRSVAKAADRPAAWQTAREQIRRTNRLEPEHPLPLKLYYAGLRAMHLMYGGPAPDGRAFAGMRRALELAPYDDTLRAWTGMAMLQAGRLEQARLTLLPLTTDVHHSDRRDEVREVIARIDRQLAAEERVPARQPALNE